MSSSTSRFIPSEIRAEVRGRYRLVNETTSPIDRVHVRLMNRDLDLVALDFPGARLELDDERVRLSHLSPRRADAAGRSALARLPHPPAAARLPRRRHRDAGSSPNGTDLNTLALTPRIGMSDVGLIEDAGRAPQIRPSRAAALPAAGRSGGDADRRRAATLGWTTADITVSTSADQIPIAPGKRVSERVENGRRIARFVSDDADQEPLLDPVGPLRRQAGQAHGGVEHAIYYHPAHHWNVDRMMTAMRASIDYYSQRLRPLSVRPGAHRRAPVSASGGQAFPNTIAVGEGIFAMDLRDPEALDMVTMLTAHELAHQWWGHQVLGARMQGGSLLV